MIPGKIAEKAHGAFGKLAERVRGYGLEAWRHTVRSYRGISWKRVWRSAFLGLAIALGGALLGAMTVVLPPMAPIGVLAPLVLILIWATPELRRVPIKTMTKAFYAVIVAEALIPYYYAIQIPGLPWLGLRRMTVLSLIILFSVSIAGSAEIRKRIIDTLSANKAMLTCFFGYILMCFLSIFSARYPDVALSQGAEFAFNWFVPAFACIILIRTTDQVRRLLKLLLWLFFVVTAIGVADFVLERNLMIDIIPKPLLARMMEAYPTFAELVNMHPYRNGYYRSSSVFVEPLSFGEYAAIVAPIGAYFMAHGEKYTERLMGALTIIAALISLFVSGARGGSIAFIASMPLFFVFWVIRYARSNPVGMAGPVGGALAFMATSGLIGAVLGIGRLHKMVLGGGDSASSDASRFDQAKLALPKILANPITGWGIGNSAEVIGFHSPGGKLSVDTSLLTLLVETGVPGLVFYFGMIFVSIFTMTRLYVKGNDRESAIGAGLSCSMLAYGIYRLVLSQRENQWMFFILVSLVAIILKLVADRAKQTSPATLKAAPKIGALVKSPPSEQPPGNGGEWVPTC